MTSIIMSVYAIFNEIKQLFYIYCGDYRSKVKISNLESNVSGNPTPELNPSGCYSSGEQTIYIKMGMKKMRPFWLRIDSNRARVQLAPMN